MITWCTTHPSQLTENLNRPTFHAITQQLVKNLFLIGPFKFEQMVSTVCIGIGNHVTPGVPAICALYIFEVTIDYVNSFSIDIIISGICRSLVEIEWIFFPPVARKSEIILSFFTPVDYKIPVILESSLFINNGKVSKCQVKWVCYSSNEFAIKNHLGSELFDQIKSKM